MCYVLSSISISSRLFEKIFQFLLIFFLSATVAYLVSNNAIQGDLTTSYYKCFYNAISYPSSNLWSRVSGIENGFSWALYFGNKYLNYPWFIFLINLLTLRAIIYFYKNLSVNWILSFASYVYFFTQYNMGAIRELCAASIALVGLVWWKKNRGFKKFNAKYYLSFLSVPLAMVFHRSGLICICYYAAVRVRLSKNTSLFLLISSFLFFLFSNIFGEHLKFIMNFIPNYDRYSFGAYARFGTIYIFYFLLTFIYIFFKENLVEFKSYEMTKNVLLIGCLLSALFFRFGFMGRLTFYFFIFAPIAISHINKKLVFPVAGFILFLGFFVLAGNYILVKYGC